MGIVELALSLVVGPDPIPFVLIDRPAGHVHSTLVTTNSVRAAILGRRIVRDHAAEATAYAIVWDGYARVDDARTDAIIVEHGAREDRSAELVAYPYRRAGESLVFGEARPFRRRPSALRPLDPEALGWGPVRPDFYRPADNVAIHVVNHMLEAGHANTVRFLRGRARVFARHLPQSPPPRQRAVVDVRGQTIDDADVTALRDALAGVMTVELLGEDGDH